MAGGALDPRRRGGRAAAPLRVVPQGRERGSGNAAQAPSPPQVPGLIPGGGWLFLRLTAMAAGGGMKHEQDFTDILGCHGAPPKPVTRDGVESFRDLLAWSLGFFYPKFL